MNTITMQAVAKTVQNDNSKAAEQHRLVRQARVGQPNVTKMVVVVMLFGAVLVALLVA